jgi:hypothetical protein
MNRFFISISAMFLAYVTFGFYLSQYQFDLFGKEIKATNIFYNYKLHQNIYSSMSIGSGTYSSISEESKRSQSKFVLFTDLNPSVNLDQDRYLLNMGQLFGTKIINDENSYTVYSATNKNIINYYNSTYLENYPQDVIVIDHMNTNLKQIDFADGLDVVNLKNIANKVWINKKFSTIWSLLFYPFNPKVALLRLYRDPDDELRIFDQLSLTKKTNLYLSSEATAKAVPITNWLIKFPSYENVFNIASERLLMTSELSSNMENDKKAIFNSLKSGSFYVSMDTLGDSTGFESYLISKRHNQYTFMGDETRYDSSLRLFFKLPREPNVYHEVILYKNGERVDHRNTSIGDFPITGPGVYRIQVRLSTTLPFPDADKWLTWIFTNNFYVN